MNNKFQKLIIKIFRISTYETEYKKYVKLYGQSQENLNLTKHVAESYKKELIEIKETCDEVIKNAEKVLEDFDDPVRKKEAYEHRAYSNGRRDAYAEMGIRALEARQQGNTLYMDENGDVVEEINPKSLEDICEEEEIEIEDLIDIWEEK